VTLGPQREPGGNSYEPCDAGSSLPKRRCREDELEDLGSGAPACDDGIPHALDDNERGRKDTVRVNPNEVVDIVVRFEVFSGRYMYHCHILEHEDRDMMRPFVVMPPELMPFMAMGDE
jgi:hypothetical protein